MFAVDLHAHTRFFHGRRRLGDRFDPFGHDILTAVVAHRSLDGVATTNHDYHTRFSDETDSSVTTIPGIEVSTTHGHVLIVGPDPPTETVALELTPAEAVEMAHERECAAIVAHPCRSSRVLECETVSFDAIEINGKHPRTKPIVESLAAEHDLPIVAGSDAHFPFEAGRAYTMIDAERLTPASVVDAIREGRVEPRISTGFGDRALRRAYYHIHRRKHPGDLLGRTPDTLEQIAAERLGDT